MSKYVRVDFRSTIYVEIVGDETNEQIDEALEADADSGASAFDDLAAQYGDADTTLVFSTPRPPVGFFRIERRGESVRFVRTPKPDGAK